MIVMTANQTLASARINDEVEFPLVTMTTHLVLCADTGLPVGLQRSLFIMGRHFASVIVAVL